MKKVFVSILFIAAMASCKKEETPPAEKTYTVEYKITATPKANTSVSGNITYVSKTSASTTATFSSSPWTVTEGTWKLKAGDKIGFTATLSNMASYQATLLVDGGLRINKGESSTFMASPTTIVVDYTVE
jgi:hypothetical protein